MLQTNRWILLYSIHSTHKRTLQQTLSNDAEAKPTKKNYPMNKRFTRVIVLWCLILLTLWVGYDYVYLALSRYTAEPHPVTPRAPLTETEQTTTEIFERTSPSVAFIMTERREGGFFPFAPGPTQVGTGSGFVWDKAGHIVTNHHVVEGAQRMGVRFGSEELLEAKILGSAPDYDLAVLRILRPQRTFSPIPIGSSENLQVGQLAYAIGNPFGLSRTLTKGIISALDRRLPTASGREIRGVIQTDAAINPGNSGGPLLDSAGRLIGVTTAIISGTGSFAGVGFAVPIDIVNRVVPQLIKEGRVPRPGIGIAALPEEAAARLEIQGVIVAEVIAGSPADKAGLKGMNLSTGELGDIITHVNNQRVRSVPELAAALTEIGIGNKAELTLLREGKTRRVEVTIVDISG